MQRHSSRSLGRRRHPEISQHQRVAGVPAKEVAYRRVSVEGSMFTRRPCLRLDGWPWCFPQEVDRRAAETKICNVATPRQHGNFNRSIRKAVSAAILTLDHID